MQGFVARASTLFGWCIRGFESGHGLLNLRWKCSAKNLDMRGFGGVRILFFLGVDRGVVMAKREGGCMVVSRGFVYIWNIGVVLISLLGEYTALFLVYP
jgi:hypothetical protein